MNPPAKLVAFLTLLAAVFGISYFAGIQSQALLVPVPTHNSEMVAPADNVAGYAFRPVEATQKPGKEVAVEFTVTAPGGQVLSDLDQDAGEHMHLIAFRRDLTATNTSWRSKARAPPGGGCLI